MKLSLSLFAAQLALSTALWSLADGALALESQVVQNRAIAQYYDLEGSLEAVHQSTVSAQTSGTVIAMYFDVGDTVNAGAVLIRIAKAEQQASLQQAVASLEQAKAQNDDAQVLLSRNQRLFEQKTLSQGEYDSTVARAKSTQAAVKAAQARLKQAQEQLAYTEVKAPYSGVVSARYVEIGELVNMGTPLMTGIASTPLRAVVDLPQQAVKHYANAKVSVWLDGEEITPEKTTLFPFADRSTHSVRLRAQLPTVQSQQLGAYAGQWVKVRIQTGERQGILVPATALLRRSELASVYVVQNGVPRLRQVRIGEQHHDQVEILAGLNAGEQIVVDALAQLAALSKQ